jgi:transaldolase
MLLVDTADPTLILEAIKSPAVHGFTTNPTLMARAANVESLPISEYISRARNLCHLSRDSGIKHLKDLMIQVVGSPAEMLKQTSTYVEHLGTSTNAQLWIKLCPTQESIACCESIKNLGCKALVTAVFTTAQAYVAMESGADGIAVYVGRLMRLEKDWKDQLKRIAQVVHTAGKTLLLASFPDHQTVEVALEYSQDLTLPPNILKELLTSPHTEDALKIFDSKIQLW